MTGKTPRHLLAALLLLAAAGCSSPPPPQTFPPLDYSYLPPITLNVATVNVVNAYVPSPSDAQLIVQDPAPPPTVLATELARRLIPGGAPGTATVTIEAASIDQADGNLVGTLTVRLDLASADGRSTGFTEATVGHSETAPDPDASANDTQAALYDMTKQLMNAMNVQLQFQIQRNLPSWVLATASPGAPPIGAPATGAIQAAPLPAPDAAPPSAIPPAAPTAIPPAAAPPPAPTPAPTPAPAAPEAPPPQQLVPY